MSRKVYPDGVPDEDVLCEYQTGDGKACPKKATICKKGWALCGTHGRYVGTMATKEEHYNALMSHSDKSEDALNGDPPPEHEIQEVAEIIDAGNTESEFRSAQQQPQSGKAFKLATLYKELGDMEQDIILHADMFDNAPAIAHKVNGVKMAVLKEMGSAPPPDPNQMTLPVGPKVTETTSGK